MLQGVFKGCNQALILRKIVGLVAEVFAEMGDLASRLILDHDAISSWAGIAACAAVAVGYEVVLWRIFAVGLFAMGKKRFGSGAAGRRHVFEFTTPFPPLRTVVPRPRNCHPERSEGSWCPLAARVRVVRAR